MPNCLTEVAALRPIERDYRGMRISYPTIAPNIH
jgi:hypothetical protein